MQILILGVLLLLAGCGQKTTNEPKKNSAPKPPIITRFYGNAASVAKGESLTICYGTENVDSLTMEPSDDPDLRPSFNRCISHKPTRDTTYTLTARGPGGETKATFSVRVGAASASAGGRVLIESFVTVGNSPKPAGTPVQLCYSTEGATAVSIVPAVKMPLTAGKNLCFVVRPDKTTTYILTAAAADGAVDRMQVTVPVQ